ncbi:fimbrial chaperone protein [Rhizobiales bacterium GAS191]|jgi:fimbrial chaperone protein|nr:fimbrial chaperone protein [Rhizobiales bacterium GAS113]SEE19644.1 fimbrial chaperone protein [Rhizobiales bacterium GAS188]SEE37793.1 fimbrial chaperone protein [Rhizobiales bacterium GAS191]
MSIAKLASAFAIALACSAPLRAASLQVQPAMVDVAAPGAASTLTLRNEGATPINVQVRVFRWSQSDGEERLEPTEDVVASPPAVTLAPHADYVARVVRVVKQPVEGEETYRLFVDELPDAAQARTNSIRLLVRHSIPVFFTAPERTPPAIDWSVARSGDRVVLSARNKGASHLRISAVSLGDDSGKTISFGRGLVGYALGRSTMRWTAQGGARGFASRGSVSISGQGNDGPFRATAPVVTSP